MDIVDRLSYLGTSQLRFRPQAPKWQLGICDYTASASPPHLSRESGASMKGGAGKTHPVRAPSHQGRKGLGLNVSVWTPEGPQIEWEPQAPPA